ncbi:MAG: DUF4251 domain-containing protein [Prolixibacteraceae bacterium]|nr:DUF4251 domain-containing protein [Prolixibacteraceae bacterium]
MKAIGLILLIGLFFSLTGFEQSGKKEKKAKQQLEMAQLIESGRFRFVARSANSELGYFNQLTSNYDVVFDSLHVKAFLPYFGRAYSVPYGGSGGVKFDLRAEKIERNWNAKKKLYTIMTEVSDSEDSYSLMLTTGLSGYADLKINFRNRRWISYNGVIEKIESSEK